MTRLLGNVGNDHMRLGTLYSLAIQTLPQLIAALKERRPHIDFELHMGSNETLLKRLSENQLDAIIIATEKDYIDTSRFEVLPLFTDSIFLTVPCPLRCLEWRKMEKLRYRLTLRRREQDPNAAFRSFLWPMLRRLLSNILPVCLRLMAQQSKLRMVLATSA